MKSIVSALHAGVLRMAGQNTGEQVLQFRVEDGEVFNTLLVATLKHLNSFLDNFLKLKKNTGRVNPTSSSEWTRVKIPMKTYTSDLITLLTTLSDTSMLSAILKQIFSLSQYYILYPRTMTGLMKRLVVCWSEGEEEVRILAFLNIRKFTLLQSHPALTKVLKRIYLAFVRNCKLTTPSTLPAIHLMEHSIVELCRIDPPTTYRHAFVYIRQLAIHLRSALSSKNKDAIQPISNWQYLHCVELWTAVLTDVQHDSLQPLVFPLVQITLGMLQLLKANKFVPLRLHCLALLLQLCEKRGVFIPVAPHLLSIMQIKMSSKTHSSGQLMGKPLDLSCMIKLSVVQLDSKSVQSSILDRSYELLLEYFVVHSHRISFPECSLPTLIELRKIAKETQFSWFKRQIKQLIEKVSLRSNCVCA
jgi:nucleolar complex protein 2